MGKDQELLEAARSGNVTVVEKILGQRAKRSGPLARWVKQQISCQMLLLFAINSKGGVWLLLCVAVTVVLRGLFCHEFDCLRSLTSKSFNLIMEFFKCTFTFTNVKLDES